MEPLKNQNRDAPGSSVVETPRSQCQGRGFDPCWDATCSSRLSRASSLVQGQVTEPRTEESKESISESEGLGGGADSDEAGVALQMGVTPVPGHCC